MKKFATCFLCLILVIALTACGTELSDLPFGSPNDSPANSNTPLKDITQNLLNKSSSITNIVQGTDFSDGVAFVTYLDEEDKYKYVAIDTTGKILYNLESDFLGTILPSYENGIVVIKNSIYDKSGKIIASPEINGYDELISENCNGLVLAKKLEQSFSGDKVYVGVLNNRGEWEHPLSDKNPLAEEYNRRKTEQASFLVGLGVSEYITDSILKIGFGGLDTKYYNIITNEFTDGYVYYETRNYQGEEPGIYKYDVSGNRTLILKNFEALSFFEDCFIGRAFTPKEFATEYDSYKIYDYNGNVIIDLSNFDINVGFGNRYYANNHLLISAYNSTGSLYLCLINRSGETAFEPIKINSQDDYYPLDEDGFVYAHIDGWNRKYEFYDYSGNITEYTDVVIFNGFNDGLALVEKSDGKHYYINKAGDVVIG